MHIYSLPPVEEVFSAAPVFSLGFSSGFSSSGFFSSGFLATSTVNVVPLATGLPAARD